MLTKISSSIIWLCRPEFCQSPWTKWYQNYHLRVHTVHRHRSLCRSVVLSSVDQSHRAKFQIPQLVVVDLFHWVGFWDHRLHRKESVGQTRPLSSYLLHSQLLLYCHCASISCCGYLHHPFSADRQTRKQVLLPTAHSHSCILYYLGHDLNNYPSGRSFFGGCERVSTPRCDTGKRHSSCWSGVSSLCYDLFCLFNGHIPSSSSPCNQGTPFTSFLSLLLDIHSDDLHADHLPTDWDCWRSREQAIDKRGLLCLSRVCTCCAGGSFVVPLASRSLSWSKSPLPRWRLNEMLPLHAALVRLRHCQSRDWLSHHEKAKILRIMKPDIQS